MALRQGLLSLVQLWLFFSVSSALPERCWRNTTCTGPSDTAFPGSWEKNIYAPSSRTVRPQKILLSARREVAYSQEFGTYLLKGNGSQIVFDFGIEVGGIITVNYKASGAGTLNLAFTEAKDWIGEWSDSSNGAFKYGDGYLPHSISGKGKGTYTMPDDKLRGGFRYMTTFFTTNNNTTSINITDITLEIGFQPTWPNLRAYQGYFHSNDELLNCIWYSGAYTVQTNAVPVGTGRQIPTVSYGWENNGTLGPGDTIIVDGAKRDRAVWPGDMGIAVPSTFVSIGDLESVKNALQIMYNTQNWGGYRKAMNYIYSNVDPTSGLLNVTGIRDWARWQQGFNNSEAQMILYHTLNTGAKLAEWASDATGLSANWTTRAENLKKVVNTDCFDDAYGAFKDNATATTLHPQDANSMSILFALADQDHVSSISDELMKNWTPIGAVAPELPENISPFISSFEIQAHFVAGKPDRALDLIRRSWGWYINNPNGTESTVIEGYLQNGTFGYRSSRGYYYDASYISHAHGWSSGPTSALTNYVLGLSVTDPLGSTWRLAPQFGDLQSVEGGFVTSLGKFQASWKRSTDSGYILQFSVPGGTKGDVVLPLPTEYHTVTLNGQVVGKIMSVESVQSIGTIPIATGGEYMIAVTVQK